MQPHPICPFISIILDFPSVFLSLVIIIKAVMFQLWFEFKVL